MQRGIACLALWVGMGSSFPDSVYCADRKFDTGNLVVGIDTSNGSYSIATKGARSATVRAVVAAEIDHRWVKSSDYPQHEMVESHFEDALGAGHQATVTSAGLPDEPDLVFTVRMYETRPFGEIQVQIRNRGGRAFAVQSVRSLQAIGNPILDLGATPAADRVLSDSFSEDWPPLQIYDLGKAPHGMHRAVGSQLIYNRQSKQSVFFGALTSDHLLTILHLETKSAAAGPTISHFSIDSTGTTEIQATEEESDLRRGPRENLIELSLPLRGGSTLSAERLMFAVGSDYHAQLETYGAAIRDLHHSRIPDGNMLGWWSWTAFYTKITEGDAITNAAWLAEQVKSFGYDYFHFDLGYGFARGEYTTANASQFPHGMRALTHRIAQLGLKVGVWTAPFEVAERSSVYLQHKDWLVHNAKGEPIQVTTAEEMPGERIFVLDATNPGAQQFLRETYGTLVRGWGVKYIKLDFMDNTAIEGFYFRPDTTALEAQRIGLAVIRETVGDDVLLDKDGSPMLNPVGLVDGGRVSQDTGHTFERSREAAPGIAARYYMHRNFFINDPDAFTVSRQLMEERTIRAPLSLDEAEVSIALSAVSGGLYEIGDDLPTLGMDADRVALIKNPDLLRMAKLGRAAIPVDLLSYRPEDRQPSVFLLRESARQSMLAVFNWADQPRVRRLSFSEAELPSGRPYAFRDVLRPALPVLAAGNSIELHLPAHSVRLIQVTDTSIQAAGPSVAIHLPDHAKAGEDVVFVCSADAGGVPALAYRWAFGDGTTDTGRRVSHTYTGDGDYRVRLLVDGVDGIETEREARISVKGSVALPPARRYQQELGLVP
jgi:hypothetical protein